MIKVKLSEICDLQNGYAFKSSDYVENSNTLSCRMSNIRLGGIFDIEYNPRFLPDSFADQYKGFLLKDGDLVIAMTDLANDPKLLGVPTLVQTDGRNILLNQRVGKLIIKDSSKVDNKYLQHVLNDPKTREYYRKFASGGLQINLGKSDLLNVEIPLPPLAEQRRIASILDKANELRQKRQQAIEKLDQLLQATFIDMFGDPKTNPYNFDIRKLSEFYINSKNGTKCGPFGSALKRHEYVENGIPVWSMDVITLGGAFIDKPSLWVTSEKFKELESYSVEQGDVIISRAGTVGKMGVVHSQHEKSLISTNLIRVRFGKMLLPEYFVALMTYCKHRLSRLQTGADGAFTHMSTGILDNLEFPYPPIEKQKQFVDFLHMVNNNKEILLKSDKRINELFSAVQNQAFSGTL